MNIRKINRNHKHKDLIYYVVEYIDSSISDVITLTENLHKNYTMLKIELSNNVYKFSSVRQARLFRNKLYNRL